ncbi:MAG: nucleotidyltransferase domain-containing protein [Roseburia sp.]|nr:nucleotidyltransferase domain-containing protein [Anaeroplasma bactoclasticum]MCM1196024.1 nucleotidyltransferase domain-containing protein [Roseburia sp.]MCM1557082.1 nucleotidyltransferase domain-containing protein [Anaeroplasma bactoclasticum]
MIRKLLCRIVSNCFVSITGIITLNDEIDALRNYKPSGRLQLDQIMHLHEYIIDRVGNIILDDLLKKIEEISGFDLKKDITLYLDIYRAFTQQRYNELIKIIFYSTIPSKYKILYLECIFNTMYYKENKSMILFRPSYLDDIYRVIKSDKDFVLDLKLVTDYYATPRRLLEESDIESIVKNIYSEFKSYITFGNIYYYGSYAKGTQDIYSDLDLFIEIESYTVLPSIIDTMIINFIKDKFDVDLDIALHFKGKEYDAFDLKALSYAKKVEYK